MKNLLLTPTLFFLFAIIFWTSIRKNQVTVMEPKSNEKYTFLRINEKGLLILTIILFSTYYDPIPNH